MNTNAELVRLSEAAEIVEQITGEPCSRATIYRWSRLGVAGVRLRRTWARGCYRTSQAWIREFFDAVTAAKTGASPVPPLPVPSRNRRIAAAQRELDEAGI